MTAGPGAASRGGPAPDRDTAPDRGTAPGRDTATDPGTPAGRARRLRALHVPGDPLVLPNAWDAATARAVVDAGFPVVATSSGAVAASLGYEDHENAPAAEMFAALARICRSVDVPVTADAEAGYGLAAPDLVDRLLSAGAVGCNLEDTDHHAHVLVDAAAQADRLAAVRAAAAAAGVDIVINARVDCWVHPGDEDARVAEGIRRARLYLAAGADCVYPIAARDAPSLEAFIAGAGGPVNVLWHPGGAPLESVAALGAARVSVGTSLFRAAMDGFGATIRGMRTSDG